MIQKGMQRLGIRRITQFNHSLITSKTQQFEPCIKHHKLIHSHLITYIYTHTYAFVYNIWQNIDLWITRCQNKETRSTSFKEKSLLKNPVKLEGLLSLREYHTWNLPFASNSFYESSLFNQVIIWSNPTYVSILGYLFLILFKVITHVSVLDYLVSNFFSRS